MNPFNRDAGAKVDVRQVPVNLPAEGGQPPVSVKVDASICVDGVVLVAGWRSGDVTMGLSHEGQALDCHVIVVSRPDVARHLGLDDAPDLGFVLVAHADAATEVMLECRPPGSPVVRSWPLRVDKVATVSEESRQVLRPAIGELMRVIEPFTGAWSGLVSALPGAAARSEAVKGHIDLALACPGSGQAVVSGWMMVDPQAPVWLESSGGLVHDMRSAQRSVRPDVLAASGNAPAANTADMGFTVLIKGVRAGQAVELKTIQGNLAHVLAKSEFEPLPSDPVTASKLLFAGGSPVEEFAERTQVVDHPVLDTLLEQRALAWSQLGVTHAELGDGPQAPAASIIVPLYGRIDFVEHQLIEFTRDRWLQQHVEIIYVIDDPTLVAPMRREARMLHELYGLPFRWLWGGANRGFSGANNLGAKHARSQRLVFLNSDAFPRRPGWVRELVNVLDQRPDIGAVGPRLVFADGSIQHAGMVFRRREDLGVWVNHHPRMGLDPALDPVTSLSVVPAITGACMAMRVEDFNQVGGWDTGYLIGDFEDSDLCLKLRAEGFSIAYLPDVELTHLERQSFRSLGTGEYRSKVVIFNAVRHQQRWGHLIEASVSDES